MVVGLRHKDSGDRHEYVHVGLAADVPSIFMPKPSSKFSG